MDLTNRVSAIGKYNEGDNARGIARAWMSSWGDITSVCSFLGMKAKIMTQGSARLQNGQKIEVVFGSIHIGLSDRESGTVSQSMESLNDLGRKLKVKNTQALH